MRKTMRKIRMQDKLNRDQQLHYLQFVWLLICILFIIIKSYHFPINIDYRPRT